MNEAKDVSQVSLHFSSNSAAREDSMELKGQPLQADEAPGSLTIPGKFTIAGYCQSKDFVDVSRYELLR